MIIVFCQTIIPYHDPSLPFTIGGISVGEDFREPEYSSFTFHLGIHGHLYHWLHLFIISDVYYEGEENLHLVLSSTDPSVEISLSMAEVIIWDDDTGNSSTCRFDLPSGRT